MFICRVWQSHTAQIVGSVNRRHKWNDVTNTWKDKTIFTQLEMKISSRSILLAFLKSFKIIIIIYRVFQPLVEGSYIDQKSVAYF